MAASPHRRTRRTSIALAAAGTVLAAGLAAGCSAVDKALDCMQTAHSVADDITDLQFEAAHAVVNPDRADASLDDIDKDLKEITDKTDNADVHKAADDLDKAVDNVRTAIKNGDRTPDLSPARDAAGELTKVCSP
ncbi:hypothetical protein ABZX30_30070 [Streptomyces sp. NPDC004542]|uniref:hypothetical protein n=1 Tax=Streptomyces sp. NPDC004542 TaxID=3154281 RepID=UPI0033B524DF